MEVAKEPAAGQLAPHDYKTQHVAINFPPDKVSASASGSTAGDAALADAVDEWEQDRKHRGMRVTFQNLEYVVRNRAKRTEKLAILKGIAGFYLPAEMAAVMGPSGSGMGHRRMSVRQQSHSDTVELQLFGMRTKKLALFCRQIDALGHPRWPEDGGRDQGLGPLCRPNSHQSFSEALHRWVQDAG